MIDLGIFIAASKDVQGQGKELVVNPSGIERAHAHHEQKISHFVDVWEEFFSRLAT